MIRAPLLSLPLFVLLAACSRFPDRGKAEHAIQACGLQGHARVLDRQTPEGTPLVIETNLEGDFYTVGAACLRARFELDGKDNLTILGGGEFGN